jgi:hypothetical protein
MPVFHFIVTPSTSMSVLRNLGQKMETTGKSKSFPEIIRVIIIISTSLTAFKQVDKTRTTST